MHFAAFTRVMVLSDTKPNIFSFCATKESRQREQLIETVNNTFERKILTSLLFEINNYIEGTVQSDITLSVQSEGKFQRI